MKIPELVKEAVFTFIPVQYLKEFSSSRKDLVIYFQGNDFVNINGTVFCLRQTCRATGQVLDKENSLWHISYWTPFTRYLIHKDKAQEYKSEEAYECQKIDADCNDCKFFVRGKTGEQSQELSRELFPRINAISGFCEKKQINIVACSNHCSGFPCFKHRKDDQT